MQVLSLFTVSAVTLASRLPCLGGLGNHILSLFVVFPLTFAMLGKAWKADFVAIYSNRAHFCYAWEGLEKRT